MLRKSLHNKERGIFLLSHVMVGEQDKGGGRIFVPESGRGW
jgi:hypothetical protein